MEEKSRHFRQNRSFQLLTVLVVLLYWTTLLQFWADRGATSAPIPKSDRAKYAPDPDSLTHMIFNEKDILGSGESRAKFNMPYKLPNDAPESEVKSSADDPRDWAGSKIEIHDIGLKADDLTSFGGDGDSGKYFPSFRRKGAKYFMYQPSGGWGNQRYILRWAIIVANAMNRTLLVAPLAPHSDIWWGYNQWQKDQVVAADRILDVKALNEAVDRGVAFIDDIPFRVAQHVQNFTKLSIKIFVKGHYTSKDRKKLLVFRESEIQKDWESITDDVIFWDKMSMWQCCTPDFAPDSVWYGRHIMFNREFKTLAKRLMSSFGEYNAVHVRRGDMTIMKDRRNAEVYYKSHHLERFDKALPLYIATNEKDKTWFSPLQSQARFSRLIFWDDLDVDQIDSLLVKYPVSMKGDVLGFIDTLICGNAVKWEGSRKSTFSAAISTVRMASQLRTIEWEFPDKPSIRKRQALEKGDTLTLTSEEVAEDDGFDTNDNDNESGENDSDNDVDGI